MAMQVKRFNWVRSATAWERLQLWQERRRAMRDNFESANAFARDQFAGALSNQSSASAELAARAAQSRVASAIQTKINTVA